MEYKVSQIIIITIFFCFFVLGGLTLVAWKIRGNFLEYKVTQMSNFREIIIIIIIFFLFLGV